MKNRILTGGLAVAAFTAFAVLSPTLLASDNNARAQEPQVISLEPGGIDGTLRTKSLDVIQRNSSDKSIEASAQPSTDGAGIDFKVDNKANAEAVLDVNAWKIIIHGALFDIVTDEIPVDDPILVPQGESEVVYSFDFADYWQFEEYPGIYNVTLLGFNREYALEKDDENNEAGIEVENSELAIYKATTTVVVGFDEQKVKERGPVLQSKNVQLAITGDNPFVISDDDTRNIVISVVNNEAKPVSGLVHYAGYNVMNIQTTKGVGSDRITEYAEDQCIVLQPGETREVRTITLDKEEPPFGGEGKSLASKMGDDKTVRAGTYLLEFTGATMSCMVGEETLPSLLFESIVVFEVN
jgi:hypothetical protein